MTMKTYDFKQVLVIFGGNILTGWAEGDAIALSPNADAFVLKVGAAGETSRSKINNKSRTLKLKFMQTASANDTLSAIHNSDLENNSGVRPLMIKDLNGNSLVTDRQAFIGKAPEEGWGAEAGDREWTLVLPEPLVITGGNNE